MKARIFSLSLGLLLLLSAPGFAQTPAKTTPARVQELARKLGSSSYLERATARKQLQAIGPAALETMRKLPKSSDLETSRQIAALIDGFEEQLLTVQILAPKEVHLTLKDATVQQAIAELAKISGYPIQFQGDATRFADKKLTLDTGKTSFWQAFDRLCQEAGLMERIDLTMAPNQPMPFPNRGGIRRIQRWPVANQAQARPSGPIIVTNRGAEKIAGQAGKPDLHKSFVSYAGAIKTELRISRAGKELVLKFIVSSEPRLDSASVLGRPALERVLDEKGRTLPLAIQAVKAPPGIPAGPMDLQLWIDPNAPHQHARLVEARIQDGPNAVKQIKELTGNLSFQLDLHQERLAAIANVLTSAGKSAAGKNGGTLRVQSVKKRDDGGVEMQVSIENLTANPFGGNIVFNGNGGVIIRGNNVRIQGMIIGPNGVQINGGAGNANANELPVLFDAKGQKFRLGQLLNDNFSFGNGSSSRNATIVFHPNPDQAEPRELVLFGTRTHTIAVPFRFAGVRTP
ncbi:MAG: hypothetical protein HYX68_25365 [Planctomycetes bacterium]|nr:hypothetical protein [Planctomycetota bacterium]